MTRPKQTLKGARIVLKQPQVTQDYAKELFAIIDANREHIQPYLDWATKEVTKSYKDSYDYISGMADAWQKSVFEYMIEDNKTKEIFGGIGAHKKGKDVDMHYEISFWLKSEVCGKGYMQEAVKLIEKEFFSLGVERLSMRNSVKNLASKNVAINLDYHFEGIQRHGTYSKYLQEFFDINVFSKLKSDYCK